MTRDSIGSGCKPDVLHMGGASTPAPTIFWSIMELSKYKQMTLKAKAKGYYVADDGTVWSKKQQLHPTVSTDGYLRFSIKIGGRSENVKVHHLMALQKFGDRFLYSGLQVRHLNGNEFDNSRVNIELGTGIDNSGDKDRETILRTVRIAGRARRRFSDEQIVEIRTLRTAGWTYPRLAKKFKCSKSTISDIINRKYYKD